MWSRITPELHENHNDYPLAPESLIITEDHLSPYCQSFNSKHVPSRKLVPNLMNKTKYVTHYRNLKFYLESGLKLGKVHRILSFDQSSGWSHISTLALRNAKSRKLRWAKIFSKFRSILFLENPWKMQRVVGTSSWLATPTKIKQLIAKPQLEQFRIINEDTVLIDRVRNKVMLDKPIDCGFANLELSKLLMYRFHYDVIKKRYGPQVVR